MSAANRSRVVLVTFTLVGCGLGCRESSGRPAGAESPRQESPVAASATETTATRASAAALATPASPAPSATAGFVVWESNRSGAFRIWRAGLSGGEPRQISPDEAGREHCCAKLSPDGRRMVYLSLPGGAKSYRPDVGTLHLADADGGRDRVLVTEARHYGEHRAAIWWANDEIVHLDGSGATLRRTLSTGESVRLAEPGPRGEGWLIAPGGRAASGNTPTFSGFDPERGVSELPSLGGCQPSYSCDGRIGIWSAGAGGPIDAMDLTTRESRTLVRKNDPRLPEGRRYVYFPMLSADSTLLALAGSGGEHDHFAADYDVLVLELDPRTLEPTSNAVVVAPHPAVDRFPDPFRSPADPGSDSGGTASAFAPPAAASANEDRARGLVLVWERGDAANRISASSPSTLLRPRGLAWLDRDRAMALGGGHFEADPETGALLSNALRASNQFSLALRFRPASLEQEGTILALSAGGRRRSLLLRQKGRSIELVLRTSDTPREGRSESVATLDSTRSVHLTLSFSPGRLTAFVDGAPAGATRPFPGDFFAWKDAPLAFGAEPGESAAWRGIVRDVAIWERPLSPAEAAAAFRELPALSNGERVVVEARLLRSTPAPSLASISPYREALAVDEIEIVRKISGADEVPAKLRRVRWAILDGETLPAPPTGTTATLVLERFADQPQLEPFFLAEETGSEAPLWFDLGGTAGR